MSNDSVRRTVLVALAVCVVCSVLVSTAVVLLRSRQEENRRIDQLKSILIAVDLYTNDSEVLPTYEERIRRLTIDLASGREALEEMKAAGIDPDRYDLRAAILNPDHSEAIATQDDLAGLRRRPRWVHVYLVREEGRVAQVVLPVFGMGAWSTMYGFLALDADLNTIRGITFHDHGETPGLGGEVDNPRWKAQWPGKLLRDEEGVYRLQVLKGRVDASRPEQKLHGIDGLSGSTVTTRGVDNMMRYWLKENGYGPFFERFHSGEFDEL